jgi:hypothetical protein
MSGRGVKDLTCGINSDMRGSSLILVVQHEDVVILEGLAGGRVTYFRL